MTVRAALTTTPVDRVRVPSAITSRRSRSSAVSRRCCTRATRAERSNGDISDDDLPPRANTYSKVYPRKATWEGTFGVEAPAAGASVRGSRIAPPWEAVGQLNEANLVWNDHLALGLLKAVVAERLNITDAAIDARLRELQRLVPEMAAKLPRMKATLVASLLEDTSQVARRLVQMKTIFPAGNVSQLATRCPALLLTADENIDDLRQKAAALRSALPSANVDKLVSQHPVEVLNVDSFLAAIEEARRLVPTLDIHYTLENNPTQIFSFQRGAALIPYDDIKELW